MKIKDYLSVAFLFILSTILILIWFKQGLAFGGGDVGLPTFNPQRIFQFISHIWWEASAPGFPRPQGITGTPFYFLLSLLQKIIPSYVLMQALIFWLVLFFMGLGMYLVSKSVFGKEKVLIPLVSSILYLVNPYMQISVWHRFVHTTFFLASTLPFLFIFWRRWITSGKRLDLLIFSLINVLGAIIFSTLGFVISLWVFLFFTSFFIIFIPRKSLFEAKTIIVRSTAGFIVWVFISLWWILPLFATSQAIFSRQHSSAESVTNLIVLSNQTAIPNTLQGINPFYLFEEKEWGEIYNQWYFLLMPFILVTLAVLGFVRGLGDRKFIFWSLLFLVSIIFAKGAAAPFGGGFVYLFSKFFVLGVLRNPFEKIGIFIPFTYAILIPIGLITFFKFAKKAKLQYIVMPFVSILLILILVIWHWPFWQGKLFGSQYSPPEVQVPDYYLKADNWIKEQGKDGRILHLPLVVGEATAYKWEYGYRGVEPSQVFFTSNPSLSQGFNLSFLDDALATLQIFLNRSDFVDEDQIRQLLKIFGIRYIVLHLDMDPTYMDVYNPIRLKKQLGQLKFLKKQNEFGKLIIYEVLEENPIIFTASSFDYLLMGEKNQFWPWLIKNKNNQLISGIDLDEDSIHTDHSIVVASFSFDTPPSNPVEEKIELDQLPSVRILPGSPFYFLIRLKEYFETYSVFGKERISKQILFASKRLVEAVKIKELDKNNQISAILTDYSDLLDKLKLSLKGAFPYEKSAVDAIFARHSVILDSLTDSAVTGSEKEIVVKAKEKLAEDLSLWGLRPLIAFNKETSLYNRRVFTFQVSKTGDYEVLFGLDKGNSFDEIFDIALDGKPILKNNPTDLEQPVKIISFGKIYLEPGYHELSYRSKKIPVNILSLDKWFKSEKGEFSGNSDEMSISSEINETASMQLPMKDFIAGNTYILRFEYWVQKGKGPIVQVLSDNDPIIKGKREMKADKQFAAETYNRYWQNAFVSFEPRLSADDTLIEISVEPWNDCEIISPIRSTCKIKKFRKQFDRKSTLIVKNVVLERISRSEIFLKTSNSKIKESTNSGRVEYARENPSFVRGKLKIDKPQVLVFAETFDKGWKLDLFKEGRKINPQEHLLVNGYANGWLVKEAGEYEFSINFDAQKLVNIGGIISMITLGGLLLWLIRK